VRIKPEAARERAAAEEIARLRKKVIGLEAQVSLSAIRFEYLGKPLERHEAHQKKVEEIHERVLLEREHVLAEKDKRIENLNATLLTYSELFRNEHMPDYLLCELALLARL
jgi:hypothetical protein